MKRPTETAFALQPKQLAAATGSAKVLELEWFFWEPPQFSHQRCAPSTMLPTRCSWAYH